MQDFEVQYVRSDGVVTVESATGIENFTLLSWMFPGQRGNWVNHWGVEVSPTGPSGNLYRFRDCNHFEPRNTVKTPEFIDKLMTDGEFGSYFITDKF